MVRSDVRCVGLWVWVQDVTGEAGAAPRLIGAKGFGRPSCSLKCIVQLLLGLIVKSALPRSSARWGL